MAVRKKIKSKNSISRSTIQSLFIGRPPVDKAYKTKRGYMLHGKTEEVLCKPYMEKFEKKVSLIFTSPPYPLNRKKKYGNYVGQEYIDWLCNFGPLFLKLLKPNGSIVMEMGNSWEKGSPVMSTLAIRSLLEFLEQNMLNLCQEFVWNNPAKLPTPAQWVTVERIRVKDSFTKVWWMSPSKRPKANNRKVLQEYSQSMKRLLSNGKYNSGRRASEHDIGETSFLKNNGGAISGSVLTYGNTVSNDSYLTYCRDNKINPHPARMPSQLAEFFIKFLTRKNDLVLDPFGGSNITGSVAESLERNWIAIEASEEYIEGSKGRFYPLPK